jgi:tRNA pseudouridine38-40 synthase
MGRYKLILAYNGAAFVGMQRQVRGRSVQSVVEAALRKLGWRGKSVLAAGRTDAGVHALGQVVAFDIEWRHTPETLLKALNAQLPDDVAAQTISKVAADFHPRYDAKARSYEYRLYCSPQRDPLREPQAWRVWPAPQLSRLNAAAKLLRGEHDFAGFGTPPKKGGATVRKVTRARWRKQGDEFVFEVSANGFLYHMVRRMVGVQVKVGQGQAGLEHMRAALKGNKVRELAPAHGLTLASVEYGKNKE